MVNIRPESARGPPRSYSQAIRVQSMGPAAARLMLDMDGATASEIEMPRTIMPRWPKAARAAIQPRSGLAGPAAGTGAPRRRQAEIARATKATAPVMPKVIRQATVTWLKKNSALLWNHM